MHYESVFSLNPGKSRAVFLPEFSVDGLTVKDVSTLKEKVFEMMKEELVKRGAKWIEVD
jgi:1-acyl-sn-glycerol-3-phosphate acyltransferase